MVVVCSTKNTTTIEYITLSTQSCYSRTTRLATTNSSLVSISDRVLIYCVLLLACRSSQKFWRRSARILGCGRRRPLRITLLHHFCSRAKFGHSRSKHTSVINGDPAELFDPSRPAFQFQSLCHWNRHGSIGCLGLL